MSKKKQQRKQHSTKKFKRRHAKMPQSRAKLIAWIGTRKKNPPVATRYSEHAFARNIGVSTQALRKWIDGIAKPGTANALKIYQLTRGVVARDRW